MMKKEDSFKEVIELLNQIQQDEFVPRNIKQKLKCTGTILAGTSDSVSMKVDKSIQELDEIAEDQFVPMHVRTQIWDIVSKLECI